MSKSLSNKKSLINICDLRLIIILLAIILLLLIVRGLLNKGSSGFAVVSVNGANVATLPLNTDTAYPIEGDGSYNLLHIENGSAYITDASCPDKICERKGRISHVGEMIVCLPNRVVVSITN